MPTAVRGPSAPDRGALRLVRAGALGGGSLLLATTAHLAGGGRLPSAAVLAVTGVLLGLVALTLTVRRCRFPLLLSALAVEQLLLHLLLDAASRVVPGCGAPTMAGHGAHGSLQACAMAAPMHSTLPGWGMWGAHLVATVLTAALLARGEAWCWRVVDRAVTAATAAPGSRPSTRRTPAVVAEPFARPARRRSGTAAPRAPPLTCVGP